MFAGSINVLLWLSYIVMLALYAGAFGNHEASFLPASSGDLGKHVFLTGIVVRITVLNAAGASTVARTERAVVGLKRAILVLFMVVGMAGVSKARLARLTLVSSGRGACR